MLSHLLYISYSKLKTHVRGEHKVTSCSLPTEFLEISFSQLAVWQRDTCILHRCTLQNSFRTMQGTGQSSHDSVQIPPLKITLAKFKLPPRDERETRRLFLARGRRRDICH